MVVGENVSKRRILWCTAGEIELPNLPPEAFNHLKVNLEWMEMYLELFAPGKF